jgi:AcrR family transcriptional regulator
MSIDSGQHCRGRRRDPSIDARVLGATNRQLAASGFEALSLAAVAHEAGTTRQALYRRWPSKAALVADAIRAAADSAGGPATQDPYRDLEQELGDFQRAMRRHGAISLVGTMLQASTDHASLACYREHVVTPRRERVRAILERAQRLNLIDPAADLEDAAGLSSGSWYARELAGRPAPRDWAQRTAALVWRAVGGADPGAASGGRLKDPAKAQ